MSFFPFFHSLLCVFLSEDSLGGFSDGHILLLGWQLSLIINIEIIQSHILILFKSAFIFASKKESEPIERKMKRSVEWSGDWTGRKKRLTSM